MKKQKRNSYGVPLYHLKSSFRRDIGNLYAIVVSILDHDDCDKASFE